MVLEILMLFIFLIFLIVFYLYRKYSKITSIDEWFKQEVGISEKEVSTLSAFYKFFVFFFFPIEAMTVIFFLFLTFFIENILISLFTMFAFFVYFLLIYTYSVKRASETKKLSASIYTLNKRRKIYLDLPFRLALTINMREFLKRVSPEYAEIMREKGK